jgi:hypothetical protein
MVKKNSSWLQEPQKTQWNQLIMQLICSTFNTNEMAEFHRRPRRKGMALSLVPTLHGRHANAPLEIHQTQGNITTQVSNPNLFSEKGWGT